MICSVDFDSRVGTNPSFVYVSVLQCSLKDDRLKGIVRVLNEGLDSGNFCISGVIALGAVAKGNCSVTKKNQVGMEVGGLEKELEGTNTILR